MWEETEIDRRWAEQEASNWMYSQRGEWNQKEHYAVTNLLVFALERLNVHVVKKPDRPNKAWMDLGLGDQPVIPQTACRLGYEYALQHVPVEL